jgi:hypothetical protein
MQHWAARAVISISVGACAMTATACTSSTPDRSEGRYCTEVGNHLVQLNGPTVHNGDDVAALLTAWRTVADSAPLAIQTEWDTVIGAMATAASADPNDPVGLQKVADAARASEPAANRLITYTFQKCGATIGNVAPVITTPTGSTVEPTVAPTAPAPTSASTPATAPTSAVADATATTAAGVTPTVTVVITTTTAG